MTRILRMSARQAAVCSFALTQVIFFSAFCSAQDQDSEEARRALIVIDVQNVYFEGDWQVTFPEGSLQNIMAAMDAAEGHGIPVVVVQHSSNSDAGSFARGSHLWQLKEEIAQRPRAHLVEKSYPGCFTGTGLEEWLRKKGVTTVTISGYMTQMCCDSTARQAFHRDFKVEFLSDATGTLGFSNDAGDASAEELHKATLVTQATVFSRVLTTREWKDLLD